MTSGQEGIVITKIQIYTEILQNFGASETKFRHTYYTIIVIVLQCSAVFHFHYIPWFGIGTLAIRIISTRLVEEKGVLLEADKLDCPISCLLSARIYTLNT